VGINALNLDTDDYSLEALARHSECVKLAASELEKHGFDVQYEKPVGLGGRRRLDAYATRSGGPAVVVEVKAHAASARLSVDEVRQLQRSVTLAQHDLGEEAVGLLVYTGDVSLLAEDHAADSDPRVYLAELDAVAEVVQQLDGDWRRVPPAGEQHAE
jgi:hypothetical protein